jgi:hypothetical protein
VVSGRVRPCQPPVQAPIEVIGRGLRVPVQTPIEVSRGDLRVPGQMPSAENGVHRLASVRFRRGDPTDAHAGKGRREQD